MEKELVTLQAALLGEFISRFSVGDTWWMSIGNYTLQAHTLEFEEEDQIAELLKNNYAAFNYTVDQEDIAKATLMAANLRKPITQIRMDESKNLTLEFEQGSPLKVLTSTDIVDWQWCINKSGKDPYSDYEIACFWAGELKMRISD